MISSAERVVGVSPVAFWVILPAAGSLLLPLIPVQVPLAVIARVVQLSCTTLVGGQYAHSHLQPRPRKPRPDLG